MKKRVRRLAALGLALVLVLGGCGKSEEPIPEKEPENIVTEPEEAAEEEMRPLSIDVQTNQKTYYFEDSEQAYFYLDYCDVTVEGDSYEKLQKSVESWSTERSEGLRSMYPEVEETARRDAAINSEFYGYSMYQTVSTARMDAAVLSLIEDTHQYMGGMHGSSYRRGINFDTQSGKKLLLSDILKDYEDFKEAARERIIAELKETYGEVLFEDFETTIDEMWSEGLEPKWYLDASGIQIVFMEYSVGPYAIGMPEVCLPYADFKAYIKEAYLPMRGDSVLSFKENQELYLTVPGTGEEFPMMLSAQEPQNEGEDMSYTLWFGQEKTALESYVRLTGAYLIRNGELLLCLIEVDVASDDLVTTVYELSEEGCRELAVIEAGILRGKLSAHQIGMEFSVDLLGTYGGLKNYKISEEKGIWTEDKEYLLHRNSYALTTTVDLPVTVEGADSILPAGSHIVLNATDEETYVKFTIQETGQTGVLATERHSEEYYRILVNGMEEYDCFENLPYAG